MSNTFIKLPTGDIATEHIREMYEDLKGIDFHFMKWKPGPALVDRKGKTKWLYTEQKFDPNYIDLIDDGWTHDDRQICYVNIGENENQYTLTEGYFNGFDWVCRSCYEALMSGDNLEEKLAKLPRYQK